MSDEYGKATCLHCGQRIEYPMDSGADSVECPTCLFPVPLIPATPEKNPTKAPHLKRTKIAIWSTMLCVVAGISVTVVLLARHNYRPLEVQLAERKEKAQTLWAKADAGDKSAKGALGEMYWGVPTNYTGFLFWDFKSPKLRSELLNAKSDWLSAEKKGQIQTLFHKADAGDKDARGELVLVVMGDIFRMLERERLEESATPEDKIKRKVHSNYNNGFDTVGTDHVALGTNSDGSVGDQPSIRLERKCYRDEPAEYQAQFYLHGKAPIVLSRGNAVHVVVNDTRYTFKHDTPSNASTNASGRAFESVYLVISPEVAYAFLSARSGYVTFEGDLRLVSFPLTKESLAVFREFAEQCKRKDDLVSKPVSAKP